MTKSKYNLTKEQKRLLRDFFDQENDGTDYEFTSIEDMSNEHWKEFNKLEGKYTEEDVNAYIISMYSRTWRGKIEFKLNQEGRI